MRMNSRALHLVGGAGSSKYYLIGAMDNILHVKHGRMDVISGKIIPRTEHKLMWEYNSAADARDEVDRTVLYKVNGGYEETVASMRPALNVFSDKTKRLQSKKNITAGKVENQIRHLEEFDVMLVRKTKNGVRDLRNDQAGLPNYTGRYQRRLDGRKTVAEWKKLRIKKHYPADLDVRVLDANGNVVSDRISLASVRRSYL
jgi:predicted DNA-binding WGR domain protein